MIKIESFEVEGNRLLAKNRPVFAYRLSGEERLESLELSLKGPGIRGETLYVEREYRGRFPYGGLPLLPREEYLATLTVHGKDGGKDVARCSFLVAPRESDFRGGYIGCALLSDGPLAIRKRLPSFEGETCTRAVAYVAAVGYHEVYLSGRKVSSALLAPSQSDYRKRVYYEAYDLRPLLKGDGDVFGLVLANGWFGSKAANVLIDIRFASGKRKEIVSTCNGDWWFATSPILASSVYGGETIDYRLGNVGDFSLPEVEPGYRKGWFGSIYAYGPSGKLLPDPLPPIEAHGRYPLRLLKKEGNVATYDALANLAGHVVLRVKGTPGTRISLRHAEAVDESLNIDQTNLRNAAQEDVYYLSGAGEETLYPHFTFHGFRYVELKIEGEADIIEAYAVHVHSSLRKVGEVEIGEPKLATLHEIAVRTEENNEQSVLSDCPQRDERFGWLNDLSSRAFYLNYDFDAAPYLYKVAIDIADSANKKGEIADTVPYFTGGQPADTTTVSFLLLADMLIDLYGEREKAAEVYPSLKKWVEALLRRSHGYVMDYHYYADWVRPDGLKSPEPDSRLISSFFLFWHLSLLGKIAGKLGKGGDSLRYSTHARKAREALRAAYLKNGLFGNGSTTETAMALSLSLYDDSEKDAAYAHMKELIELDGFHLNCGNQGYRHAFYELCRHSDIDLAFKILRNPEYPGWGYMLENGATSVWERWEKAVLATMNSFNHPMFASYDALFFRFMAGIEIADIESGNGTFDPSPLREDIPFSVAYSTRKGTIKVSSPGVKDGKREYTVEVPYGIVLFSPKLGRELGPGTHKIAFNV